MLSPHDVHAKGSAIISLGADTTKIQASVAFEMATEPLEKAKQLQANHDLVQASQGKLANMSGQERYLTCGSSHLTAFCRAVQAQCHTEDEWLSTLSNGHLSLDAIVAHGQDHVFRDMVTNGWNWTIISHSVEKALPELPVLVQQALNTVGAATMQPHETEVLQTVSHLYQMAAKAGSKPNLKACLDQVATSKPTCLPYLETIGYYLTKYGGGSKFPCITMLQHIGRFDFLVWHKQADAAPNPIMCSVEPVMSTQCFPGFCAYTLPWAHSAAMIHHIFSQNMALPGKSFGASICIGEEMFSQVAYMDFKQKSTTFPWLRASILSCQLSAPKCQDGIGKCLGRHEVDKLKSNQNKTMVLEAENFLTNHWDQLSAMADGKGHGPEGLSIMGRCIALHLTKKESKGRDTTVFQDLAEISAKFQEEVSNFTSGTTMPTNPSASSHEEPTLEPESLEDRFHDSNKFLHFLAFAI